MLHLWVNKQTKMSKKILLLLLITFGISSGTLYAQTQVSGKISDKKGEPVIGANVFVKGSFDGGTTNVNGEFKFKTDEAGEQVLVAAFIGYNSIEQKITLAGNSVFLNLLMVESINKLDGVVITAGSFEASDEKKAVVLKSLDIAMTAGATADIAGALNTLPGTQTVGESGRLFVRGGESHETKVFVGGMLVNNFFGASAPNTPARGRFSPFLFSGTMFSTGGYSAEYGQALSSALMLNSKDLAEENQTDISLMSVGGSLAHTKIWNRSSITAELGYSNLQPYFGLVKQSLDWEKAPRSAESSFVFRQKSGRSGLFKLYGNFNIANLGLSQSEIGNEDNKYSLDLTNNFYYLNASYKNSIGEKWTISGGTSMGLTKDNLKIAQAAVKDMEINLHSKVVVTNELSEKVALKIGSEIFANDYEQTFRPTEKSDVFTLDYKDIVSAGFVEVDIYLSNKFVARPGVRVERSSLFNEGNLAPRLSLAYKTGASSQFSFAFGEFFQTPEKEFLKVNEGLTFTKAAHYILNYQVIKSKRVFRAELYHKSYDGLIKFQDFHNTIAYGINNEGRGYANGVDLFWRDRKSIKNGDYWISYSLLDSKRNHRDFTEESRLALFSTHNFSVVYKHFIPRVRTQIGFSYVTNSGRPYHDPNKSGFMNSKTKPFHNLSFNAAFLYKQNIIFYASATNLLGHDNVFGYQFSPVPNDDGIYASRPIGQPAPRFLFVGLFITLTKGKEKNQLDNL
jgi:hypothetical protein